MIDFEGIAQVRQRITQNGTMLRQIQALQEQVVRLGAIVDATHGTSITQDAAAAFGQQRNEQQQARGGKGGKELRNDGVGNVHRAARDQTAGAARIRAINSGTPG